MIPDESDRQCEDYVAREAARLGISVAECHRKIHARRMNLYRECELDEERETGIATILPGDYPSGRNH